MDCSQELRGVQAGRLIVKLGVEPESFPKIIAPAIVETRRARLALVRDLDVCGTVIAEGPVVEHEPLDWPVQIFLPIDIQRASHLECRACPVLGHCRVVVQAG